MLHTLHKSHPLTLADATAIAELRVCSAASIFTDIYRVETSQPSTLSHLVRLAREAAIGRARDRLMDASDTREYLFARMIRGGCGGVA